MWFPKSITIFTIIELIDIVWRFCTSIIGSIPTYSANISTIIAQIRSKKSMDSCFNLDINWKLDIGKSLEIIRPIFLELIAERKGSSRIEIDRNRWHINVGHPLGYVIPTCIKVGYQMGLYIKLVSHVSCPMSHHWDTNAHCNISGILEISHVPWDRSVHQFSIDPVMLHAPGVAFLLWDL